jgi:hypothetical protein
MQEPGACKLVPPPSAIKGFVMWGVQAFWIIFADGNF